MPDRPSTEVPFLWGAATSAHQIEGHNESSDWWAWEAEGHIEGGIRSGAATDHWNRFQEDIRLAAELGLNSYRFSIEWARIEPKEGQFDASAIEWYSNLMSECERHGLMPMVTLHHFTSPQWFAKKGGFAWDKSAEKFARFVKHVAITLGDRVPLWCTLNEPMVLVSGTYLGKFMPPAEFSPAKASAACHNLLRGHALAYDILHSEIRERKGPWADVPLQVGIAHNLLDFLPDRGWHPIERILTGFFKRFYNQSWLDAVTGKKQRFGVLGFVPRARTVQEALGRKTVDFIGVNYYTKAYVQWRPKAPAQERPPELPIGLSFARRKETASDLGWAVHDAGFYRMIRMASRYGLPLYITENGIADREDAVRPKFIVSHLKKVAEAIREGIDIRGYYYWSLLDNFEWIKGFWPRFGLYQVNYETFERIPTRSAHLYREIIQAHRRCPRSVPDSDLIIDKE